MQCSTTIYSRTHNQWCLSMKIRSSAQPKTKVKRLGWGTICPFLIICGDLSHSISMVVMALPHSKKVPVKFSFSLCVRRGDNKWPGAVCECDCECVNPAM